MSAAANKAKRALNPAALKVRTVVLAEVLDTTPNSLARWAREKKELAACRWRRGWWDVRALRAAGFLQEVARA